MRLGGHPALKTCVPVYICIYLFIYFSGENPFLAGGEAASRGQRLPAYPQCCGGGGAVAFPTRFSATFLSQPSGFTLSWDAIRHFRSVKELPPGLLGVAPMLWFAAHGVALMQLCDCTLKTKIAPSLFLLSDGLKVVSPLSYLSMVS